MEAWSLNHWTAREVPKNIYFKRKIITETFPLGKKRLYRNKENSVHIERRLLISRIMIAEVGILCRQSQFEDQEGIRTINCIKLLSQFFNNPHDNIDNSYHLLPHSCICIGYYQ